MQLDLLEFLKGVSSFHLKGFLGSGLKDVYSEVHSNMSVKILSNPGHSILEDLWASGPGKVLKMFCFCHVFNLVFLNAAC